MGVGDPVDALAARFDVPASLLERVAELGQLPREADGRLGGAAARRASLLSFALSHGIPQQDLLAAMGSYGDLFVAFDAMGMTPADEDSATVLAQVGLDEALVDQLAEAACMDLMTTPFVEDVAALRSAKEALDLGLPLPVLLQLLRVFADNMERLAEAENRIFHDHVHEQFRAAGLSGRELMEATAGISTGLLRLVEPTVLYFHRRAWATASQHDFLRHLTEDSRPLPSSPGAAPCAVLFADLSGFTALTAAVGDRAAAEVLSRFGTAVRRVTVAREGRVVKQIGDAFMLVFEQPRDALLCGADLLGWCAGEPDFPALHIGGHAGDVLFHDGDYVGATVNLAARIASVTDPSQFLVTDELVQDLELPPEVDVVPLAPRTLKGLEAPVSVSAVRSARAERRVER